MGPVMPWLAGLENGQVKQRLTISKKSPVIFNDF